MTCSPTALTRFRGDTYPFTIQVRLNGRVYDLTDCTLKMTVTSVEEPTTETPEFALDGVVASPATLGLASFAPSAANVDLLGEYYYDIQVTDANGYKHTPIKDTLTFTQDITKV